MWPSGSTPMNGYCSQEQILMAMCQQNLPQQQFQQVQTMQPSPHLQGYQYPMEMPQYATTNNSYYAPDQSYQTYDHFYSGSQTTYQTPYQPSYQPTYQTQYHASSLPTVPEVPSQPAQEFRCSIPGCNVSPFSRRADMQRHVDVVHNRDSLPLIDCLRPDCRRKGRLGFTRKDKMVDHMREVHKEDIPKRVQGRR